MGLAQALGWTGVHNFIDPRRNTLTALGASLLSGRPGVGVSEGIQADTAYATQQKAEADRQAQINQTAQWARNKFPELADAPDEIVAQMAPSLWEKQFMGGATDPTATYDGRLKIGQDQGLTGTDLTTYALTGKLPEAPKPASLPTSYQEFQLAQQDPKYAATLNSTTSKPPTEAVVRNRQLLSVVEPEAKTLIGDATTPGLFEKLADPGDQARAAGGDGVRMLGQGPSAEYQTASNALRTIIQNYLYSVSGATATPGEVENQAAILTPRIGESAQSVADKKRRIQQMVDAIKIAAQLPPGAGGNATSTGVQWSYEP